MEEQNPGESVRINNTFIDIAGELYDPETIELKIYDPEATLISTVTYFAGEIIRDSEGVYYYNYNIESDAIPGYYITNWNAVASGFADISEGQFRVVLIVEKLYITVDEVKEALMSEGYTMDDDVIRNLIRYSMAETDAITGRSFYDKISYTEWFDTMTPNPATPLNQLFLFKLPVQSVTSLQEFDTDGNLIKTHTSDEFYLDNGIVTLLKGSFGHGVHRVKCEYEYGYSAVPRNISMLTSIIAQIKVMRQYLVMQDSEMTGFDIPEIGSVQVGEVYMTAQISIRELKEEYKRLISVIGDLRNNVFVI